MTESQNRFLTNYGVKADVSIVPQAPQPEVRNSDSTDRGWTRISAWASPTRLQSGLPWSERRARWVCLASPTPAECSSINPLYVANPKLLPGLVPYDLTRGGSYFQFHGLGNIDQAAFYVTDDIKLGDFSIDIGFRDDQYNGLVSKNRPATAARLILPGESYRDRVARRLLAHLRDAVQRESAAFERDRHRRTGARNFRRQGQLSASSRDSAISSMADFSRRSAHWLVFDADYFWKFTHNAYDFDVLFNTPITFPIAWHNSKLDGLTGRLSTISLHGFQASTTLRAHARPLLSAGGGRVDFPRNGERTGRLPDRSRSGVPADHQSPLSTRQGRAVGHVHLALRQRTGGYGRAGCGRGLEADAPPSKWTSAWPATAWTRPSKIRFAAAAAPT